MTNNDQNHRIFLALPAPPELQAEAIAWEEKFLNMPVRWLVGKNLHITLVPPFYEENISEIISKLSKIEHGVEPFKAAFNLVQFGPSENNPRLIWARGETPSEAVRLSSHLQKLLGKEEKGEFGLHLTLARFREEDFPGFKIKKINDPISWSCGFDSFALFEAHLHRNGADYEIIQEFKLK